MLKDIEDMTWGEIEEKIGQVRYAVYILGELIKNDQSHLESIETKDDKYEEFIKGRTAGYKEALNLLKNEEEYLE